MEEKNYIRGKRMYCPLCDKVHFVEERTRTVRTIIKEEEVEYEESYSYCSNAAKDENEYVNGEMMNHNLLNARNAYRVKHHLLTSDEIIGIRELYGLSQVDFARLLGWGEATISRYESKAIQDEAYDNMMRLVRDNPMSALRLLELNAEKFTDKKRKEIRSAIIEKINAYGKEYLAREALRAEYVKYEEPSDYNGYAELNVDKIEAIISYFANKISNLFKVKLMKLLWYSDVFSYKYSGHSMTGLVYVHKEMGALPLGHNKIVGLINVNCQEERSKNYDSMIHFYPVDGIDYNIISCTEKEILDSIIHKFDNYSAKDMIDYMHEENAYKETKEEDIIPFSLTESVREFCL